MGTAGMFDTGGRFGLWAFAAGLAAAGLIGPASAQNAGCDRLQAQIASLSRGNPGQAAKFGQAAQKQRSELDRTSAYANSIGCSNRKFLIFGSAPPPQCAVIEGQILRMRANLNQLQDQADSAGGGNSSTIRDLTLRFNAQCRAAPVEASNRRPGLFENLFGATQPQQFQQIPLDPPQEKPEPGQAEEEESGVLRRGGSKAVCVRTCDGAFFPVSYSARRASIEGLGDLCHALCPNAETKLFTYRNGADIDEAIASDGEAYADMPNAFKFQKSFDPACACKAKGQSWVEALADAERILGQAKSNDIVVTPAKSEELARPSQPQTAIKQSKRGVPPLIAEPARLDSPPAAAASIAVEGEPPAEDAQYREVTGADGVKRRVRIIGPKR